MPSKHSTHKRRCEQTCQIRSKGSEKYCICPLDEMSLRYTGQMKAIADSQMAMRLRYRARRNGVACCQGLTKPTPASRSLICEQDDHCLSPPINPCAREANERTSCANISRPPPAFLAVRYNNQHSWMKCLLPLCVPVSDRYDSSAVTGPVQMSRKQRYGYTKRIAFLI